MKTSIEGFNQSYAMTLKKRVKIKDRIVERKIDCTDLVILRWFVDFFPKMKKMEIDGIQYAWLSHKKLCEDLPLIDISKRAFIERMQKLVEFGILTYIFVKESGSLSLYGFGENYIKLITSNCTGYADESIGGMRSNCTGVCVQPNTEDKSIKDKTIINNNIDKENNDINIITKEKPKKERKAREFTPPTVDEVNAYSKEKGYSVDGQMFVDYYEANGWKVDGKPMKNWKLSVVTWENNNRNRKKTYVQPKRDWNKEMECHNYTEEEINSHITSLSNLDLEDL